MAQNINEHVDVFISISSIFEWCEIANASAYGLMGLKPWEFDELTIMEFYAMLDGCYEYKLGERRAAAWFVANIMASSGNYKHGIDIEKLLASSYSLVFVIIMSNKNNNCKKEMANYTPDKKNTNNAQPEDSVVFYPSNPRYNFDQIILDDNVKAEIFDAI